jgi:2-polyprenyl-6-methoxyphenol hydroxylase-like FAD-dependent oxidoreductase
MKPITIVGGGLAGLTLGIGLRQRGVPVIIYEAGHYPRHRVCGEFISGRGRVALDQLGLLEHLNRHAMTANDAAFFVERKSIHHKLPEPALSISRYDLDALLARTFQQLGGELKTNERWTGQFVDGVIRATGRRAQTSSASGRWFGLKCHAKNVSLDADLEMHVLPNGYVGISRLPSNEVNICGLFRSETPVHDLSREWKHWLCGTKHSTLNARLINAQFDEGSFCSAAGLDFCPHLASKHAECSIGDAVTMIAPATGNGMSMAFESAIVAVEPLASFSSGQIDWDEAKDRITSTCDQRFARRLKWARRLQHLLMSRPRCAIALGNFSPIWRLFFFATR